jgi:hypothetical protein
MGEAWRWFLHYTGSDNPSGPWYGFWSGFGSDLGEVTLIGAVLAGARHRNCHFKGCWRLGHPDPEHGHPVCRGHQAKLAKE